MKKTILSITLLSGLLFLNACGNEDKGTEKDSKEENAEETPEAEPEVAEVECDGPMMDFMAMLKGGESDVEGALNQYGIEGLERMDMDMYLLQDAKVISCSKSDSGECCTMEAESGITIRTYDVCWEDDKIVAIVDKGMR